ncbi:hypothetical protein EJ06DRAFT_521086 [Trichodelitschia bisporula]|uniref:Uncharacterized protein n=1 Tax=Trichodelitschia bisporula TaxID=703511 RepID=A0A6G1HYY8_9PEZI|nr:hypothetical protein EJ06DRAFT_521086 [Trichodelitschia bisporula]
MACKSMLLLLALCPFLAVQSGPDSATFPLHEPHQSLDEIHLHVHDNGHVKSSSDSQPSDAQERSPYAPSSPSVTAGSVANGVDDSDVSSDDNLHGDTGSSEDADYEEDTGPRQARSLRDTRSSTTESTARKRKSSLEFDDEVMANPDLYGLRRSGRPSNAKNRRIVDSSDEEDASDEDDNSSSYENVHRKRVRRKPSASTQAKASKRASPALPAHHSDSDSDVYVGARRNILTKKQKQHRMRVAAGLVAPTQGDVRFSTRRAAKVASYNEEELDSFEEDSENTPYEYVVTAEDNSPAIDIVLDHRVLEGVTLTPDSGKDDFEYFIKWQGKAHIHSSWETFSTLKGYRGYRRLENYFRKIVLTEIYYATDPDVVLEDKERWALDREVTATALKEYQEVERVIGSSHTDEGIEYYVKWKGLFYDSCTWEQESLVNEIAQVEIDRYLNRSQKISVSDRLVNGRGDYRVFKHQPSYIKHGELREFQILGVNFLCRNWCLSKNVMLADEMGLGKTVQTVSFLSWLRHEKNQQGPFIIIVPLSTMPAWAETFNNWTPDMNYVVYNGNEAARTIIRDYELLVNGDPRKTRFNVLLTTYEYVLFDYSFLSQIKWQFMAIDEAHRLKNRDSQLYSRLAEMKVQSRLLITGTPMQNNLEELRALMDFLMPGEIEIDKDIDLQSDAARHQIDELTHAIRPYMLRRTKQLVEKDLPPKTEKIIRVELSDVQLEYYKNILTRNYAELNKGSKGQKQSLLNIMMELKKASNHPFMFPNAEDRILDGKNRREDILRALITSSGKMMLLDRLLDKLKKDGHRVLIFSQMVKMLDILSDYLNLRGYQHQRLDGTMTSASRRQGIDHFNAPDSDDFCYILSTRAGGLGINLMTADTVILFDSDWNPQADLQAMARAHRIGQKNPVMVYRFVSKDTVEEEVLERARNKLMLEFLTIQRGVTDSEMQQLAKKGANFAEPTSADDISRILKRRGQKMFEQNDNQKKLEELDIDAVLATAEEHKTEQPEGITADGGEEFLRSFEYTDVKIDLEWDEIIPKERLEAIQAEEKRKADDTYLASVIEQNTTRKRKAAALDQREQRAAKKKAREAAKEAADDVDQSDDQHVTPTQPLNESETRRLIKAYERYGAFQEKGEDIAKDAGLTNRDPDFLKGILDDLLDRSRKLLEEERQRQLAMEKEANKSLTKKDKKAVIFTFKGVNRCNAETLIQRESEMRLIREAVATVPDRKSFRIPEATKAAEYSRPWTAREDGMLIVGISKHGWGAWADIRDDPELGLADKVFLEEQRAEKKAERKQNEDANAKKPTQVHLIRRANYLISVLKDKASNGTDPAAKKLLENHHRSKKRVRGTSDAPAGSPAPNGMSSRKGHRDSDRPRNNGNGHSSSRPSLDRRADDSGRDLKRRADESDRDSKRRKYADNDRRRPENHKRHSAGTDARRRQSDVAHQDEDHRRHTVKREDSDRHRRTDEPRAHNGLVTRTPKPDHTPNPKKSEPDASKKEASAQWDDVYKTMFTPVSTQMRDFVASSRDTSLTPQERLDKMRGLLLVIGDFVVTLGRKGDGASLEKLWGYVGHKCFKGSPAAKASTFYHKSKALAANGTGSK